MTDAVSSDVDLARHALRDLGFFGHYLHVHAGGRSGQGHILVTLLKQGGHMPQRDLQELSCISAGALSEVLSKLEGAELIERTRSDEDRRLLDIALTAGGRARAQEVVKKRQAFEEQCLACLDASEREQLVSMLDRMVEHWESLEGKEGCA